MKLGKIGTINKITIATLGLSVAEDTPIFVRETNIEHMKSEHPADFAKYGEELQNIISSPDYVSVHPNNGSIQYIKVFFDEEKEERVLVAVRTSNGGTYYARSLFIMSDHKIKSYTKRKMFKKYKSET